ncbi:MAG: hypothetical protein H7257_08485, partial [Taibaiella sp.]|nr:hypothetical protein [Taibaiella sp.]
YGRLTPVVYLNLKSNNEFKFSLCATGSLFIPAHANENSYLQFGGRISVRYKAYEMYLAPGFSKSSKAPSTLIMNSNWREQQLNIGLVVYPSSLLQWPGWMSRIRGKDVAPLGK